jgi:hypothetical protein
MRTKTCTKCGLDKEVNAENFGKRASSKDGFAHECKTCKAERDRKYREANKERLSALGKEHYQKNREKVKARSRKYYENNREHVIARGYEYKKRRLKEDPVYRMRESVSNSIYCALFRKDFKGTKRSSVWSVLPYTPEQLKEHLEAQFDEYMAWDNYGDYWHIDHIYPQSLLPYDSLEHENFQKCWALENLQPLEAIENMKKSNKII